MTAADRVQGGEIAISMGVGSVYANVRLFPASGRFAAQPNRRPQPYREMNCFTCGRI
jgi:hypothetical protein